MPEEVLSSYRHRASHLCDDLNFVLDFLCFVLSGSAFAGLIYFSVVFLFQRFSVLLLILLLLPLLLRLVVKIRKHLVLISRKVQTKTRRIQLE